MFVFIISVKSKIVKQECGILHEKEKNDVYLVIGDL